MNTGKQVVLVPWDFTEGSEIALKHALQLADVADNEILLLHLIPISSWGAYTKKRTSQNVIDEKKRKLEKVAERISKEHPKFTPIPMVLEGDPVKMIKELIVSANLNLIVAHKHYVYDNKKLASYTFLRKIAVKDYSIPFIIAEAPPLHNYYIEIVVPLDYDKKYKETLRWIIYLSKYYRCNINLIKPYISDQGRKKEMANNIYFTKKMLDGNKIVYGIKTAKRQNLFRDEIFKFANSIEADLILIMADKYNSYVKPGKKPTTNIPIMCITPRIRRLQGFA